MNVSKWATVAGCDSTPTGVLQKANGKLPAPQTKGADEGNYYERPRHEPTRVVQATIDLRDRAFDFPMTHFPEFLRVIQQTDASG